MSLELASDPTEPPSGPETLLPWGDPVEEQTALGAALVSRAEPDQSFWDIWRTHKELLRSWGIRVAPKSRNSWDVLWYHQAPGMTIPQDPKEQFSGVVLTTQEVTLMTPQARNKYLASLVTWDFLSIKWKFGDAGKFGDASRFAVRIKGSPTPEFWYVWKNEKASLGEWLWILDLNRDRDEKRNWAVFGEWEFASEHGPLGYIVYPGLLNAVPWDCIVGSNLQCFWDKLKPEQIERIKRATLAGLVSNVAVPIGCGWLNHQSSAPHIWGDIFGPEVGKLWLDDLWSAYEETLQRADWDGTKKGKLFADRKRYLPLSEVVAAVRKMEKVNSIKAYKIWFQNVPNGIEFQKVVGVPLKADDLLAASR